MNALPVYGRMRTDGNRESKDEILDEAKSDRKWGVDRLPWMIHLPNVPDLVIYPIRWSSPELAARWVSRPRDGAELCLGQA